MKTKFKFISSIFIMLIIMNSCQKDDLETDGPTEPLNSVSSKTYNNGTIKEYNKDVLLKWNEILGNSINNKMPPPAEAKIYAMVTLAMHDALNNIIPKYNTYALNNSEVNAKSINKNNISPIADAAISQSAYDVLTTLYPPAKTNAETLLNACLAAIEDSEFKTNGIMIGHDAATAILLKRQSDNPIGFSTYDEGTNPGIHQSNFLPWMNATPNWPVKATYGADLGSFTPFGMASSNQFRAVPPYSINSPQYAADLNEVKQLGCTACPDRTDEQTEIGTFWVENLSSSMNRLARALAVQEKLDIWETARLFALVQMAQIDANISSFEGKYYYKFWRPITAIKGADSDGNDDTSGDLTWINSFVTPPTPDYPSTHAEAGGAGAEMFKLFFGTDKKSFTTYSPYYLPNVERNLINFSQIATESSLSRIYIGYHFRNSVEQGVKQGRALANYVYENNLTLIK